MTCLKKAGGAVTTNARVLSLEELGNPDLTLLDVTPRQLLALGGPEIQPPFRRQLERYRYGPGVFKVDWALSQPIPWHASECLRAGTVHLGGTFEEIAASERAPLRGTIANAPLSCYPSRRFLTPAGRRRESKWPGPTATCPMAGQDLRSMPSNLRWNALLPAFASASWAGQSLAPRRCTRGMKTWWEATSTEAPCPACNSFSGRPGGSTPPRSAGCTCARRLRPRAAVSTACAATGQPSGRSGPSGAIKDFEHREVIVRWCAVHEDLDLAQHALDGGTFKSGLQPVVAKKLTGCAFRLGNAIGGQDDAVAGLELKTLGVEAGLFDQANDHVGIFQPLDALGDWPIAAVHARN